MRLLLLLTLLYGTVFGYNYNELLIKAQSDIFPKLLLLDKKLSQKLVNGKIVYAVIYEEGDIAMAKRVREEIYKKHSTYLGRYPLEVRLQKLDDIAEAFEATAVYTLNLGENIYKVVNVAMSKGMMSFSYDINNLENGMLLSMMIEKVSVLYLNKEHLQYYPVDFVDALYQITVFE